MILFRSKKDDRREQPTAVAGTGLWSGVGAQWGAIPLPQASSSAVLGLPAAGRSVNMISNAIAQMAPLDSWTPDGYVDPHPPAILVRPNVTYTTFDYIQQAVAQAIIHGNHLALHADLDVSGYPQQLVPIPTGLWHCYYDAAGYLVYEVAGVAHSRDQVFHVRVNATANQPMGVGVVTQYRRAFGQALDQQNFAADTYRSGAVPAGIINLNQPQIDKQQAEDVTTQWLENHAGGRAPAVLPNTMTFEALQFTPEDMQFLEARQFTIAEIAYMFNLDPTDLGASLAGQSMTYANIEQRQQQRITDSYAPWMIRFEQEFSDCIPDDNTARFDVEKLLRTDSKTRADVDAANIESGVTTADEARKRDGKRPLPKKPEPKAEPMIVNGNGFPPPAIPDDSTPEEDA